MAKGDSEAVVSFDLAEARRCLGTMMQILSPNREGGDAIRMKLTVRSHGSQVRGLLNDFVFESRGFGSRHGLPFQQVEQTTIEILGTLKLMCDELSKYLEVVPGVVQKQMLLCETADLFVKQMRSHGMNDWADSKSDAVKNVLGHVVSR